MQYSTIPTFHSRLIHIIRLVLYILFAVAMASCSSSTKPKTGSISGSVQLSNDTGNPSLDPVDNSGVSVLLYSPAEIDTALARINQEYPQIGLGVEQSAFFDHRLQSPITSTTTTPDGGFTIDSIPEGTYNLVFIKDGWSIRYLYDIEVIQGDDTHVKSVEDSSGIDRYNSVTIDNGYTKNGIVLYPVVRLTSAVQSSFNFRSDHTYFVESNLVMLATAVFEPNTLILVSPGSRIDYYSSITSETEGHPWWITSSFGMFDSSGYPDDPTERFSKITHSGEQPAILSNGKITCSQESTTMNSQNSSINRVIFLNGGEAILGNANGLTITQCVVANYTGRAVYVFGDSVISDNIFVYNHDNLVIVDCVCEVMNNYFANNWVGVRPYYGDTSIHHNNFSKNTWSISTVASSPLIHYNNFYDSSRYCIQTQVNYVQVYHDYSNPIIHSNNFLKSSGIVISLKPDAHAGYHDSGWVGVNTDVNATHNYWKASDPALVINDVDDDPDIEYRVLTNPRIQSMIPAAGIH